MINRHIDLIGLPLDDGASRRGCSLGPAALRLAGLQEALAAQGHIVRDCGDVTPAAVAADHRNQAIRNLAACAGWIAGAHALDVADDATPVFLGGDHLMTACTLPLMAARARRMGRPLHVLWLDAHSDFHDLDSTQSGNLHGTPAAYATGQPGFDAFPAPPATVAPADVTMLGLRSVDSAERARLGAVGITVAEMRELDERGAAALARAFVDRARAAGAMVHVSFDVDFLDPDLAPAVGTTVPGGATFREAHLIMEILCEADVTTSLDLAELNPMLDERGRTATVMVDLAASLFGKTVLDRPTPSSIPGGAR